MTTKFNGQTIATLRQAIEINGEAVAVSEADVIAELEARHDRALAKGKGSRYPARILYRELTGKELPSTKLVQKAAKQPAKAPAKAAKQPAKPAKAAEQPVDAKLAARYAKTSTAQLENWLRRAKPEGDKANAIRMELQSRAVNTDHPEHKAKPKASGSDLDRAREALSGLDKPAMVTLLESLLQQ